MTLTTLPETPGGERNWDYRFTWIRDSSFMLRALYRLGFGWEAIEYFGFILDAVTGGDLNRPPEPARRPAPDGHGRAGSIPVSATLAAGRTVQLWVDTAGSPTGPPPRYGALVLSEALVAVLATAALGAVLWWLAGAGRWMLDRRRLAGWETAWAAVGPQWTWRFRSRGQP